MTESVPLLDSDLTRLHRQAISQPDAVIRLLRDARARRVALYNGINRRHSPRTARVVEVSRSRLVIRSEDLHLHASEQVFFSFSMHGVGYFFSATVLRSNGTRWELTPPERIFEAERRDLERLSPERVPSIGRTVAISRNSAASLGTAEIVDSSYDGLGVRLDRTVSLAVGESVTVSHLDGDRAGEQLYGVVRHVREENQRESGWIKVGLSVSSATWSAPLHVEHRNQILANDTQTGRMLRRLRLATSAAKARRTSEQNRKRVTLNIPPSMRVEFANSLGHKLVGLADIAGDARFAPAVVIPPAWGRTKESLSALALIIVESFRQQGESVAVLRFDGSNQRGESYVDPANRSFGDECLGFTFSRAVDDLRSALGFLRQDSRFNSGSVAVVSFSLASVVARRAIALDDSGVVGGWISVVGMPDLQSGLRSVSGGIDYASGLRSGVSFGIHELVGVRADMDRTGQDALAANLVFLEDARRDMRRIDVPVTWYHGRHDAWIDFNRVQRLLSAGEAAGRRLIELPIGHQLRSSAEAMETFLEVARETSRVLVGAPLKAPSISVKDLMERERAERRAVKRPPYDPVTFWSDYLLGDNGSVGIDLMALTASYRGMMDAQIDLLRLQSGSRVLDLGAGTGSFGRRVAGQVKCQVVELDLVRKALKVRQTGPSSEVFRGLVGDLEVDGARAIPLRDASFDSVLMSLLISYVRDPEWLLRDARRVLRPGGRVVVSSMRRDADISQLYREGFEEILTISGSNDLSLSPEGFLMAQRRFLNRVAHLFNLEEAGVFRFWAADELVDLLGAAGFSQVEVVPSFGDPPQATIVAGVAL